MVSVDTVQIKGSVKVEVLTISGYETIHEADNIVVTGGKQLVAAWLAGEGPTRATYMAIGTLATATDVAQTALQGSQLERKVCDSIVRTGSSVAYVCTFEPGEGTGTVEEAALFNAASGGTMFSRFLTGTYDKGALDEVRYTWTLTII